LLLLFSARLLQELMEKVLDKIEGNSFVQRNPEKQQM
jgi:hypothetical protein